VLACRGALSILTRATLCDIEGVGAQVELRIVLQGEALSHSIPQDRWEERLGWLVGSENLWHLLIFFEPVVSEQILGHLLSQVFSSFL